MHSTVHTPNSEDINASKHPHRPYIAPYIAPWTIEQTLQKMNCMTNSWLLLANVLFLTLGLSQMAFGTGWLLSLSSVQVSSGQSVLTLILGLFYTLTGLVGFIGACCQSIPFLWFYITAVWMDLGLAVVDTILGLMETVHFANNWAEFSLLDWILLSDKSKALLQTTLQCCGFDYDDGFAYTGQYFKQSIFNVDCSMPSSYPGCHESGMEALSSLLAARCFLFAFILFVSIVSLAAAYSMIESSRPVLEYQPVYGTLPPPYEPAPVKTWIIVSKVEPLSPRSTVLSFIILFSVLYIVLNTTVAL